MRTLFLRHVLPLVSALGGEEAEGCAGSQASAAGLENCCGHCLKLTSGLSSLSRSDMDLTTLIFDITMLQDRFFALGLLNVNERLDSTCSLCCDLRMRQVEGNLTFGHWFWMDLLRVALAHPTRPFAALFLARLEANVKWHLSSELV